MTHRRTITTVLLFLLVGLIALPAMAMGPRASGGNNWPGMSQPATTGGSAGYRPDSAEKFGIYDDYCYHQGGLSLDNSGRNR